MIRKDDLTYLGFLSRTHGNQGVLQMAAANTQLEDYDPEFVFLLTDNLYVPFRIEDWRGKGAESLLLTLSGIKDEATASRYVGCEVYMEKTYAASEDGEVVLTLQDMVGYTIQDTDGQMIGHVKSVDESTLNALFEVELPDGNTFFLPAHDDFVMDADYDEQILTVILPEGIIDLN